MKKRIFLIGGIFTASLYPSIVFGVEGGIPGYAEPGVASRTLMAPPISPPPIQRAAVVAEPEQKQATLAAAAAAKIKFKLTKIILEGNKVFTEKQLKTVYEKQLNKTISILDLQNLVQGITNFYRNNGYIISRAILPPQHVKNGVVKVKIIEGFIAKVDVKGNFQGTYCLLKAYGSRIVQNRPTEIDVLEHYLRVANEIPGLDVKSVLEPSKKTVGAADMTLVAEHNMYNLYTSYDNYGTRYLGPNQASVGGLVNSLFMSGDITSISLLRTSRAKELRFYNIMYEFAVGCDGLRIGLNLNRSFTVPGLDLAPLETVGDAIIKSIRFTYPLIRARDEDLTLDGSFDWTDSKVNVFSERLYLDHIRTLKFGGLYDFADQYQGSNTIVLHIHEGLKPFGATKDRFSPFISRFGANGQFTKFTGSYGRLQQIYDKFSGFFYISGQYSFTPLLATEEYFFGGSQLGRGYNPAEILGDRGAASSLELRYDLAPDWDYLKTAQPYLFYDTGIIWNIKDIVGIPKKQSATSTGFGVRITFTSFLSGNFMLAQPLTKKVAAEEIVGKGSRTRGFFSVVASI